MKKEIRIKLPLILLLLFLFIIQVRGEVFAQISRITPNISPSQAINNVLLGAGVTASNITFNGSAANANIPQEPVHQFTNTSPIFPLNNGVLVKTSDGRLNPTNNISDIDLNAIASNSVTNGAVIEFDFVPVGDSISFSYIFASSEYGSFTCSEYNDVFGFFISGPGISGPHSNNSKNIAIIPGSSNIPVGINTVNSGNNNDLQGYCNQADPNWASNSVYFNSSYNSVYNQSDIGSGDIEYNGSTIELIAGAKVICGETYHIKLAIGNVGDKLYNSGVFLKAGSFSSDLIIDIDGSNTTSNFLDSVVVEGCDEGKFCFTRPEYESADSAVVHYKISGSATLGIDYTIPNLQNQGDSIVLLPGEEEFCLQILLEDDGVTESLENVILSTFTINTCGDTTYSIGELWIVDKPIDLAPNAGKDTVVCNQDFVTLYGESTTPFNDVAWTYSGPGTITFLPNNTTLNAEATFSTPGVYKLYLTEINDTCSLEAVDSVEILYGNIELSVSNDTTICENGEATLTAFAVGGNTFKYIWGHTADNSPTQSVSPLQTNTYTVFAENNEGCSSLLKSITVDVLPPLNLTTFSSQTICLGESINIFANVSGGNGGPYNYIWTDSNGDVVSTKEMFMTSPEVTTTYTVTVNDNCESTTVSSSSVVIVGMIPEALFSVVDGEICSPASFQLINNSDSLMVEETYWYISDGQTFINKDTVEVNIKNAGQYSVELVVVTSEGCVDSLSVNNMLTVYPKPRAEFIYSPNPVTIFNTEVKFQNFTKGGSTYEWSFEEGYPNYSFLTHPTIDFPEEEVGDYEVDLYVTSINNCKDTIRKTISVLPEVLIYVPNAFTPDGNEHNSLWKPSIEGVDLYGVTIEVFNRWGQKVWESHDLEKGWDGTYLQNGTKVKVGTYVWKIKASDSYNDNVYEWEGHVSVLY